MSEKINYKSEYSKVCDIVGHPKPSSQAEENYCCLMEEEHPAFSREIREKMINKSKRKMNNLTLITVNWNQQPCVELLLKSYVLHHYKGEPLKLLLADNGSTDGSKEWLQQNGIPFYDAKFNRGHENTVNSLYDDIHTKYALLVDTDIEFKGNVYGYIDKFTDTCISAGEMIDKNYMETTKIKDRISPWFLFFDAERAIKSGIKTFRDPECYNWIYDVGSYFTEQLQQRGFENYNIERLPGNQDQDIVSMKYPLVDHIGKVSWDLSKHQDRIDEVMKRRGYIQQRLKEYEYIDLKNKFIYG